MIIAEEKVARLQKWILEEAYRNGQTRINGQSGASEAGPEKPNAYFIHRHDIYRRYFKLPNDPLHFMPETGNEDTIRGYRQARLRSAVILCESVRELLKSGLIRFFRSGISRESPEDISVGDASFLFLTETGVRKAESLF
jgi:hypothetical protein